MDYSQGVSKAIGRDLKGRIPASSHIVQLLGAAALLGLRLHHSASVPPLEPSSLPPPSYKDLCDDGLGPPR